MTWPSGNVWSGGVVAEWSPGMRRWRWICRARQWAWCELLAVLGAPALALDPLYDLAVQRLDAGVLSEDEFSAVVAKLLRCQRALGCLADAALWLSRPGRAA
jgi:hypothetical protein